jgi:ferredoxin
MPKNNKKNKESKKHLSSRYKIIVDRNLCIGAATCIALSPKVFQLDQENKAIVIDPDGDTDDIILMAARSCPVNAVIVIDKKTGKQIYP